MNYKTFCKNFAYLDCRKQVLQSKQIGLKMGTQPTKINPKSHKFTKLKNWAHQIYQRIYLKARFTNAL